MCRCNGKSYNDDDRVETAFEKGTMAWELCESACHEATPSAFVCLWQAVANLHSVCTGSFGYNSSLVTSENSENLPSSDPNANSSLWDCDEHAVCLACRSGGQTNTSSCDAVMRHYHGFSVKKQKDDNPRAALVAIEVLNTDLEFWCTMYGR